MIESELRETLFSYLPGLLAKRLVDPSSSLEPPETSLSPAAVFFADIKGFTAITEKLAEQGPAGAEELTHLLNTFFGQIIDVVHEHGGDVIKFAGDALLAIWQPEQIEEDLTALTHRAAQCALAVQEAIQNKRNEEGVRLSLKIAIGSGTIRVFFVGGVFNRCEFYVAGEPIVQVGKAGGHCQADQVVLSPDAWNRIRGDAEGKAINEEAVHLKEIARPVTPTPRQVLDLPESAEATVWSFIPRAIRLRLEAGQTGWLAELRNVTVLFVSLPDMNHGTPLDLAQNVMKGLQTSLYHYEGSVNKLSVDDKGVTLLAAMGLPPLAHEDDAVRGVHAALAIQSTLQKLGVRGSIGVAGGRVFCGAYGSSVRREYTMIGDTVNLAARLMQAAKGGILCNEVVYQAAQERLSFEELKPIQVKGKCEPVPIYRPSGSTQTKLLARSVLVGREIQQEFLTSRLEALLNDHQKTVLVIEGDPGIGKSKLLANLLHQAKAKGMPLLIGAGDSIEKAAPYYAWRTIFHRAWHVEDQEENKTECKPLQERLMDEMRGDEEMEHLAPLVDVVLPVNIPDNEMTAEMTGEVRADNTNELLVKLLQKQAARMPLLIVLEDGHWLDSASWALAHLVARDVHPLLLVVVTRPLVEPAPPEYIDLMAVSSAQHLKLNPLTRDDTRKMLCQRLRAKTVPEPVVDLVFEKAQGNPFFSEQLIYALRESGVILINDEECGLAPDAGDLATVQFPDTVQGVVTGRIDGLSVAEQLTLKVASVIGSRFPLRLLLDVHPMKGEKDKDHLAHLQKLEQADLIAQKTYDGDQVYRFKQAITQEVAYNLMLISQRKRLHEAVAQWYEKNNSTMELTSLYPLLAHHWDQAEVLPKAIEYLEKAADQALNNHANEEAIGFYRRLLALDSTAEESVGPLRRAKWERSEGTAYFALGNMEGARRHFRRAVALLGFPAPQRTFPIILKTVGQIFRQFLHRVLPGWFVGKSQSNREVLLEAAGAYEILAEAHYHDNEKYPCLHAAIRSLNLAERAGTSIELARTRANASVVCSLASIHSLGAGYVHRSAQVVQEVNDLCTTMYCQMAYGLFWCALGAWKEAEDTLQSSEKISRRIGDSRRYGETLFLRALMAIHQGHFHRAANLAQELKQAGANRGAFQLECWGSACELWSLLQICEVDESARAEVPARIVALDGTLATHVDRPNDLVRPDEVLVYGVLALGRWYQGDEEKAIAQAKQAAEIASQCEPTSHFALPGYASIAEVLFRCWESIQKSKANERGDGSQAGNPWVEKDIAAGAKKVCKDLRFFSQMHLVGWPLTWHYQAWYYLMTGKKSKAIRTWKKCRKVAEKMGMPYEQALAQREIGRATGALPADASLHQPPMWELFQELRKAEDEKRVRS